MGGSGQPTARRRPRYLHLAIIVAFVSATACATGQPTTSPPIGSEPTPSRPVSSAPEPSPEPAPTGSASAPAATPASGSPSVAPSPFAFRWHQASPAGAAPGAREDHTWTIDNEGRNAYLFGGRAGDDVFDDLWRYDLREDAWRQLDPAGAGPAPRFGHVAVWLADTGLVVWSGQRGSRFFNDAWLYDPTSDTWRELPAGGAVPEARYGSCGGIGPDGRLWISHGFTQDDGRFDDTRAYDFATGVWTDMTPAGDRPVNRCLHDCLWTPAGELLLYGGQTTGVLALGDAWLFDPVAGAWTEQQPPPLDARQLFALASLGDTAWVYGGGTLDGDFLSDLWQVDLTTLAWTELEVAGPAAGARSGATLIADPDGGRLLLFGGTNEEGASAELWQLDLADDPL